MPRTKKIGRPRLKKKDKKYNYTCRLTDQDRVLLEVEYGTVAAALRHLIDLTRKK